MSSNVSDARFAELRNDVYSIATYRVFPLLLETILFSVLQFAFLSNRILNPTASCIHRSCRRRMLDLTVRGNLTVAHVSLL
jgi:hypothetical protein